MSLTEEDVAILDRFAMEAGLRPRSAAVQQAIRRPRHAELDAAYAAAWEQWAESSDAAAWESTAADGVTDAPR